tara:strand:- start:787 stop:2076 length:1290 start_codon:yes stop_codon:yes gene_type:complete
MTGLSVEEKGASKAGDRGEKSLYDRIFLWISGFVTFFVCTFNIGSSLFNNQQIVLVTFMLALSAFLATGMRNIVWPCFHLGLIFTGWLVFSNLVASLQGLEPTSWSRVADLSVQVAAFLVLAPALRAKPEAIAWVLGGVVLAFFVNSGLLVLTWSGLENPESYNWVWGLPNFVNIRFYASFLMVVAAVSIWGVLTFQYRARLLYFVLFFLAIAQMLWSGSRSPLFALLLAAAIVGVLLGRKFWLTWVALIAVFAASVVMASLFPVESDSLGVARALGFGNKSINSIDELGSGRLGIWRDAAQWIVMRPILGWGGDYYREASSTLSLVQVHNGPLQMALEWGIPFAVLLFGLLARLAVNGLKRIYTCSHQPSIFLLGYLLFLSMLLHSALDGVFYHGTPLFFMMLAVSLVTGANHGRAQNRPAGRMERSE